MHVGVLGFTDRMRLVHDFREFKRDRKLIKLLSGDGHTNNLGLLTTFSDFSICTSNVALYHSFRVYDS